jgi:hypothetical protein
MNIDIDSPFTGLIFPEEFDPLPLSSSLDILSQKPIDSLEPLAEPKELSSTNLTRDSSASSPILPLKKEHSLSPQWIYPSLVYTLDGQEHRFLLKEPEITLGRAPQNHVALPFSYLSRVHCKFTQAQKCWFLEDCLSYNGTYVNQNKVSPPEKVRLYGGEMVKIGQLELCFKIPLQRTSELQPFRMRLARYVLYSSCFHVFFFALISFLLLVEPPSLPSSGALNITAWEVPLEAPDWDSASIDLEDSVLEEEKIQEQEEIFVQEQADQVELKDFSLAEAKEEWIENPLSETISSFATKLPPKKKKTTDSYKGIYGKNSFPKTVGVSDLKAALKSKLGAFKKGITVLNVTGTYDRSALLMNHLKIPYMSLSAPQLSILLRASPEKPNRIVPQLPLYLDPKRHVLLLNCGMESIPTPDKLLLIEFIALGGSLITTDWSIEILEELYPEYVGTNKNNALSGIFPVLIHKRAENHPLLEGVSRSGTVFHWWFEGQSWVPILKSPQVQVLVELEDPPLPVAITFRPFSSSRNAKNTSGHILHYSSHLFQQISQEKGNFNLQLIFVNFLLQKQALYEIAEKK